MLEYKLIITRELLLIKDMREAGLEPAHPEIVSERFYPRMGLY